MSRKLTSYPWKACQRDISLNFASKEASASPFVQYSWFSLQCLGLSRARQIANIKRHTRCEGGSEIQQGHRGVGKFLSEPSVA